MADASLIVTVLLIITFGVSIIFAFIYSLIVLLVRRFRHSNNMFTLNICLSSICSNLYFLIFFVMLQFDIQHLYVERLCLFLFYAYIVCPLQVPLAFMAFSIHRFCLVMYHTHLFFQRRRWVVICIVTQWLAGFLIAVPYLIRDRPHCLLQSWMQIYGLATVVIAPAFICLIINLFLFMHARASSRRIQAEAFSVQTAVGNVQQARFNRRDMHLLQQMIFIFCMFMVGWSPVFLVVIINAFVAIDPLVIPCLVLIATLCLLAGLINLFIHHREVQQFLREQIDRYF